MFVRRFFVILTVAGIASIAAAQRMPVPNSWIPGPRLVVFEGFYNPL